MFRSFMSGCFELVLWGSFGIGRNPMKFRPGRLHLLQHFSVERLLRIGEMVLPAIDHVAQRQVNQQHRIAAGVRDGQISRGQAFGLERREAGIHHEVRTMRSFDHGRLTPRDRRVLYHQQNRTSRRIYRDRRF